jgi:hypothetical protein
MKFGPGKSHPHHRSANLRSSNGLEITLMTDFGRLRTVIGFLVAPISPGLLLAVLRALFGWKAERSNLDHQALWTCWLSYSRNNRHPVTPFLQVARLERTANLHRGWRASGLPNLFDLHTAGRLFFERCAGTIRKVFEHSAYLCSLGHDLRCCRRFLLVACRTTRSNLICAATWPKVQEARPHRILID